MGVLLSLQELLRSMENNTLNMKLYASVLIMILSVKSKMKTDSV